MPASRVRVGMQCRLAWLLLSVLASVPPAPLRPVAAQYSMDDADKITDCASRTTCLECFCPGGGRNDCFSAYASDDYNGDNVRAICAWCPRDTDDAGNGQGTCWPKDLASSSPCAEWWATKSNDVAGDGYFSQASSTQPFEHIYSDEIRRTISSGDYCPDAPADPVTAAVTIPVVIILLLWIARACTQPYRDAKVQMPMTEAYYKYHETVSAAKAARTLVQVRKNEKILWLGVSAASTVPTREPTGAEAVTTPRSKRLSGGQCLCLGCVLMPCWVPLTVWVGIGFPVFIGIDFILSMILPAAIPSFVASLILLIVTCEASTRKSATQHVITLVYTITNQRVLLGHVMRTRKRNLESKEYEYSDFTYSSRSGMSHKDVDDHRVTANTRTIYFTATAKSFDNVWDSPAGHFDEAVRMLKHYYDKNEAEGAAMAGDSDDEAVFTATNPMTRAVAGARAGSTAGAAGGGPAKFCPSCGTKVQSASAAFCASCGTRLPGDGGGGDAGGGFGGGGPAASAGALPPASSELPPGAGSVMPYPAGVGAAPASAPYPVAVGGTAPYPVGGGAAPYPIGGMGGAPSAPYPTTNPLQVAAQYASRGPGLMPVSAAAPSATVAAPYPTGPAAIAAPAASPPYPVAPGVGAPTSTAVDLSAAVSGADDAAASRASDTIGGGDASKVDTVL